MSHNYGNNQRRSKRTSGIRRGRKYRKARQYGGANTKGTENYQNDLMWDFYTDRDLTDDPTVWDSAKAKIEAKTAAPTGVTDMLNLTDEIKEIWTKHNLTDAVTYGVGQPTLNTDEQYEKIKIHKFMIALILKQYDYINFHAGPLPALSTIRRNLIKSFADENDATKVNQINSFVWDKTDKARDNNTASTSGPPTATLGTKEEVLKIITPNYTRASELNTVVKRLHLLGNLGENMSSTIDNSAKDDLKRETEAKKPVNLPLIEALKSGAALSDVQLDYLVALAPLGLTKLKAEAESIIVKMKALTAADFTGTTSKLINITNDISSLPEELAVHKLLTYALSQIKSVS
jgi:hypothetical protein